MIVTSQSKEKKLNVEQGYLKIYSLKDDCINHWGFVDS